MSPEPSFILDSFAILSYFQNERGSERVIELLELAQNGKCRLLMSLINLGEVCYLIERRRGLRSVHLALAAIQSFPIQILPADQETVLAAAHLKAVYPISFADAFAAAAAQTHAATLLTGDPEFTALTPGIQIEWLVPRP